MGKAIDFSERNDYIGKPPNMTDNQCYALPICRIVTFIPGEKDTDPAIAKVAHISCWELTDEEVAEVIKSKRVYLKTLGTTTFPVSVHGIKPIYVGDGGISDKIYTKEEIDEMKKQ